MNNQNSYFSKNSIIHNDVKYEHPIRTYGNVTIKSKSILGAFSFINTGTTLFPGTKIGRYCSIGKNCEIGAFDHPIDWLSSSPIQYNIAGHFPDYVNIFEQQKFERPNSTIIGNDVWIGSLVIIKRGLKIGDGAIIAGGAVVIGDVPPYAIVGGVPARILKYRFEQDIIKQLLELKWWDRPLKELKNVPWKNIQEAINYLQQKNNSTIKQNDKNEILNELKSAIASKEGEKSFNNLKMEKNDEFYTRLSYRLLEYSIESKDVVLILEQIINPYSNFDWNDIYDIEVFNNKVGILLKMIDESNGNIAILNFKIINRLFNTKQ